MFFLTLKKCVSSQVVLRSLLSPPSRVIENPIGLSIALIASSEFSLFPRQKYHASSMLTSATTTQDATIDRNNPFKIKVEGPWEEHLVDHKDHLLVQLPRIPRDIQFLQIEDGTPSNTEWSLLGGHFTSVKNLEMDSGFNEDWNDEKLPLHWPLERLLISSACGEVFQSPTVLEGRVKHLILLLTSGLRFEGPTSQELCRADKEAISRGEKEARRIGKIEVVYIPELVADWMRKRYASYDEEPEPSQELPLLLPKEVPVDLEKLEILENDAIDAFNRMTLALPHVIENLSTLNIRSTHNLDFHFTNERLFPMFIPQLTNLRTLVLSVGDIFKDNTILTTLYEQFPPNLSTLRLRGPASLVRSDKWADWVDSFAASDFLPKLERLSFVLDLHYEQKNAHKSENTSKDVSGTGKKKLVDAPDDMLREAQDACKRLYGAVERRGVKVEPFYDQWSERSTLFKQVDERWMRL